ncbi:MAG: hypothetical protein DWI27_08055 [Planctomycetota bacterium]|nr:MAG: hypothetical protein DWI27_08055 [Planctomycetota bacterium]
MMRISKGIRVAFGAAAVVGFAGVACAQLSIVEQLNLSGTVESVARGRLTVRNEAGERREVLVQAEGEQGVALADGRLLAFPADVRVTGRFDVAKLKPGQVVRFQTRLNGLGKSEGELAAITLIDATGAAIGVTLPAKPADFADCTVTAAVKLTAKGRLAVELPKQQAFHGKTVLSFKVAKDVDAQLESGDLRLIEPGAKVVRLEAVRLDSGDVVAKALVVETAAAAAVKERGDEKLANKYRGLSDEPPKEPRLIRSAHFAFLTDVSDREGRIILDKLERMAGLLEKYFGRGPTGLIEGFIVRDLAAFPAGTLAEPDGVAKIREGAGICFNARLGDQRKATLYSCADHGVIQHECTHGFCHMAFGSTGPTWLAEGVAELGNYWKEGEQAVDVAPAVMGYLQQAQPKRGLLEIAVPGRTPSGTWQDYAWRWALCHMLANNPNYADRFKPLAIALMEERPGVSFETVYGPVAKEVSFEYDQFLKTVGNGYRADLVPWPWKARFRPLTGKASLTTKVKAAAGWQASGLTVERGDDYAVQADGDWKTATAGEPCTAAGAGAGRGRLEAAVLAEADGGFTLSAPIALGPTCTFTAPITGQLVLRCADDWTQLADNEGELEVTLRRAGTD